MILLCFYVGNDGVVVSSNDHDTCTANNNKHNRSGS